MNTEQEKPLYIEMAVAPDQLSSHTSMGWEVVERFEFDEPIPFQDSYIPQGQSYHQQFQRTQIGRSVGFRIRRAVDSPIAALNEQITKLQSQHWTDESERKKAEQALGAEQEKHRRTQAELARAQEHTEQVRKDRDKIEAIKRQFEADIGKIREHIGRKMFDEILPPPPPKQDP